ncbi:transmembrane protease serine 3 [Willisornis vidua]|uniref:Transmembrane protease serine 3 n=1 Tax=Willisornis vidua TaxID=1566151 RepID=A0ABQ9DF84_9PASS|nr:transmembrane protease serine 3 [Willisornis vidua]
MYCVQFWCPQKRKDMDLAGARPEEATKMPRGMENLCYGDRLGELGLFSLEKKSHQSDQFAAFQYLKEATSKFRLDIREKYFIMRVVQETNPTTGSLEIISVTEDESPVPQIQFTFKRFFFIPQARVDPSADGSGDIEPPSMCHAFASLKYFPYICGFFLAVILAAAIGLGVQYNCIGKFRCRSSFKCIQKSARCNGVFNCKEGEDEYRCVRLSGKKAVLQVFTFGSWRTVCSDDWRAEYGNTTCKHLGFSSYVSSGYLPVTAVEKQFQRHFVSLSHWFSADQVTSLHNATNLSLYLPSSWSVQVGFVTQQDTQVHPYSVEKIIYHRNYKPKTMGNDIALMKLAAPLALNGDTSDTMNYAGVPLISNAICNHRDVYGGIITSSMLCAGFLKGGVDTCQGDSGGPLACEDMSIWKLVGTTSFGVGCAEKNKPGVYSRTTSFLDWIHEQMEVQVEGVGSYPLLADDAIPSTSHLGRESTYSPSPLHEQCQISSWHAEEAGLSSSCSSQAALGLALGQGIDISWSDATACVTIVEDTQLFTPLLDLGKESPTFLDISALQDGVPWDSVNQIPKKAKVCSPEVHGSSSADPNPYPHKNKNLSIHDQKQRGQQAQGSDASPGLCLGEATP